MDHLVVNVGIIGLSEGNGHPFSFSAIINGYSESGLAASGWPGIYDYVRRRDRSEFGIDGLRVTHAWTQDSALTKKLCDACLIPYAVSDPKEFLGNVDAVIIARDDFEIHFPLAMPFLKAGLHVFVDKPLSVDTTELISFRKYLENGRLMSCSGMRYARELDEPRASLSDYGELKLVRGAVLNSWEQYGVHLIDAIFNVLKSSPVSVVSLDAPHTSMAIHMSDGSLLQLDALGEVAKCFRVDIFGTKKNTSHEIIDNFSMFRRMLWHFSESIRTGTPAIPPHETLDVMRILIAGRISIKDGRKVHLDEIQI